MSRNGAVAFAMLISVLPAAAQILATGMTGNVTGTVSDPSGAIIPQATIIATTDEGNREATRSDDSGQWSFHLAGGRYTIEVSKHGFETYRREGVEVDSSADVRLDIPLAVAPLSQAVDVVAPRARKNEEELPAKTPAGLRVGGNIDPPKPVRTTRPQYPEAARQLDIEGPVVLQAVIGTDGSVLSVQPSIGQNNADLVTAAMNAVQQWQYKPALLNGVPVEVQTNITVNFRLQ